MEPTKPKHLKAIDPWDPSEDPRIQAAIKLLVENTPPEKYPELVTEFERRVDLLVARRQAEDASPISRRARKNTIRAERAGKVRGKRQEEMNVSLRIATAVL